jgi:processive 1,2-diacylglycerol beta-glucosyltransferase
MKKRVLILSASAGTGHVRAGAALEKAFAADPRVEAVEHHDALQFTTKLFRDFYSKLYMQLVRSAPEVLGWAYKASDEPWKNDAVRLRLDRLQAPRLVRMIRKFRPDITICTHFMPTGIMAHLIQKGVLDAHLSIVVTDLDMHAMWLSRTFHRYFVALEETKAFMQTLGVPEERVTVSGIPIDPVFAEPVDRAEVLRGLDLDPALPTILFSAGAFGVSPAEFVVGRLMKLHHPAQIIVVCGRSEEARQRVLRVTGGAHPGIRVLGFTDRMHELMHAAALFIGKPGGLTVSEVLACGLPMVVIAPIPGQEERNSDHLLEEGVALKCNDLANIRYKIDRLLDDPARMASMREKARALGRPDAAREIVSTLLDDRLPPLELPRPDRNRGILPQLEENAPGPPVA